MISHIVLFEPKPELTQNDYLLFAQQLGSVLRNVPGVIRAEIGRAVDVDSGQRRNFGGHTYNFSAVITFSGEEDLVAYLNHPEHIELGRLFWEYCRSTVVMEAQIVDGMTSDLTRLLVKR